MSLDYGQRETPTFRGDDKRERHARQATRLGEFRRLCMEKCTKPSVPDFSDCNNAEEVAVVKMAGNPALTVYRQLVSDDETAAVASLSSFAASLNVKAVSLSCYPEPEPTSIDDEVRQVLIKLGLDPDLATCNDSNDAAAVTKKRKA